jgi:diguanylate cyclase (GGDEF)-like protein
MGRDASLLFFDLDDFKRINDTFGHAEGGRALATFATALRESLRESDVIGRLGGDEFVALLTDAGGDETQGALDRLRQALTASDAVSSRGYRIRFSVGQTQFDAQRHASVIDLLASSDSEMYAHKTARKHGQAR